MITHEKLAFMTDNGAMTIDYCNGEDASASQVSYSVLRSKFDAADGAGRRGEGRN